MHRQDVLNGRRRGQGLFRVLPFDYRPHPFRITLSTAAYSIYGNAFSWIVQSMKQSRRSTSMPNSKSSIAVSSSNGT
jgi:hypothetical protein